MSKNLAHLFEHCWDAVQWSVVLWFWQNECLKRNFQQNFFVDQISVHWLRFPTRQTQIPLFFGKQYRTFLIPQYRGMGGCDSQFYVANMFSGLSLLYTQAFETQIERCARHRRFLGYQKVDRLSSSVIPDRKCVASLASKLSKSLVEGFDG